MWMCKSNDNRFFCILEVYISTENGEEFSASDTNPNQYYCAENDTELLVNQAKSLQDSSKSKRQAFKREPMYDPWYCMDCQALSQE